MSNEHRYDWKFGFVCFRVFFCGVEAVVGAAQQHRFSRQKGPSSLLLGEDALLLQLALADALVSRLNLLLILSRNIIRIAA